MYPQWLVQIGIRFVDTDIPADSLCPRNLFGHVVCLVQPQAAVAYFTAESHLLSFLRLLFGMTRGRLCYDREVCNDRYEKMHVFGVTLMARAFWKKYQSGIGNPDINGILVL